MQGQLLGTKVLPRSMKSSASTEGLMWATPDAEEANMSQAKPCRGKGGPKRRRSRTSSAISRQQALLINGMKPGFVEFGTGASGFKRAIPNSRDLKPGHARPCNGKEISKCKRSSTKVASLNHTGLRMGRDKPGCVSSVAGGEDRRPEHAMPKSGARVSSRARLRVNNMDSGRKRSETGKQEPIWMGLRINNVVSKFA